MKWQKPVPTGLKILALSVVNIVIWMISLSILGAFFDLPEHPEQQEVRRAVMVVLFVVSLCNISVLSYAVLRSRWRGWKLVITVFWVYFGINTFNSQIETLYFNEFLKIPFTEVIYFIIVGTLLAAVFSPIAVLVLGRFKKTEEMKSRGDRVVMSFKEIVLKIVLISFVVYPLLYFLFGYFVAWQFQDARLLYSGSAEKLPFFTHFASTFSDDPWLYPWQVLRSLIWVSIAVPVIRMSIGGWRETGVMVGLLFAIIMNIQHLLPNPYMPRII
ncbi:hypothetical protein ES703_122549 [subsurface metagenome]